MHYSLGSDDDPFTWGEKNTTEAGDKILLNAINWLTGGGSVAGDFDGNGLLELADIYALSLASASGTNDLAFDLTSDGVVDANDVNKWMKELNNSWMADANLDREFNSSDLVAVFQNGLFETNQPADWSAGDWNGDGQFSSTDFVAAFQDGGFEQGPRAATQSVPEPIGLMFVVPSFLICLAMRRRTN